jgi:hypothetical protein
VKLLKLRETSQQHMQELNSLKTERSTMLIKIQDLEEKLLETQLQLERVLMRSLLVTPHLLQKGVSENFSIST